MLITCVHQCEENPEAFTDTNFAECRNIIQSAVTWNSIIRYIVPIATQLSHLQLFLIKCLLNFWFVVSFDTEFLIAHDVLVQVIKLLKGDRIIKLGKLVFKFRSTQPFDRIRDQFVELQLHFY